jgi:hypothetical protein
MRMPIPTAMGPIDFLTITKQDFLDLIQMAHDDLKEAMKGKLKQGDYPVKVDLSTWVWVGVKDKDEQQFCYACLAGVVFIRRREQMLDWACEESRPYRKVMEFLDSLRHPGGWLLLKRYGFKVEAKTVDTGLLRRGVDTAEVMLYRLEKFLDLNQQPPVHTD